MTCLRAPPGAWGQGLPTPPATPKGGEAAAHLGNQAGMTPHDAAAAAAAAAVPAVAADYDGPFIVQIGADPSIVSCAHLRHIRIDTSYQVEVGAGRKDPVPICTKAGANGARRHALGRGLLGG